MSATRAPEPGVRGPEAPAEAPAVARWRTFLPLVFVFVSLSNLLVGPMLVTRRARVLTSSSQPDDVDRAYDLRANSYLVEPATREGLREIVRMPASTASA
jgi:hypothetical protein